MVSNRSVLRAAVEPAIAAAYLVGWIAVTAPRITTYISQRSDTFATNPYSVMIAIGFALAIGLVRYSPIASIALTGGLLACQLLFWPARFSQTSWTAYLGLLLVAIGVGLYGGRVFRWIAMGLTVAFAVAVSALLNFATLSLSGTWGTINGKPNSSPEVPEGFEIWGVVVAGLAVGAWFVGARIRKVLGARGESAAAPAATRANGAEAAITSLSPREREIFLLAARGLSNAEIAREAHIGESTVKTHLASISAKLGVVSRAQLVVFAYESGLLTPATA